MAKSAHITSSQIYAFIGNALLFWLYVDHKVLRGVEKLPVWHAALCAREAAVCGDKSVGQSTGVCWAPQREGSHYSNYRCTG